MPRKGAWFWRKAWPSADRQAFFRPELALRLFAWADAMREVVGDVRPLVEQADVDRDLATIRAQLDETAIAAARAEGRAMSLDQAIAYALEGSDLSAESSAGATSPKQ